MLRISSEPLLVYICTAYTTDSNGDFVDLETKRKNLEKAKLMCAEVVSVGHIPICAHTLLGFMDDGLLGMPPIEKHRTIMDVCLKLLKKCSAIYIGERSKGAVEEIREADHLRLLLLWTSTDLNKIKYTDTFCHRDVRDKDITVTKYLEALGTSIKPVDVPGQYTFNFAE